MAGAVGSKLGSAGGAVAGVLGGGGSGTASLDPMKSGVLNVGGKSSVFTCNYCLSSFSSGFALSSMTMEIV